jgi:protein SCO1/2
MGEMKINYSLRHFFLLGILILVSSIVVGGIVWKGQMDLHGRGAAEERPLEGLQKFGAVPPFSLTERDRRAVTLSDLKGKVWIVNFIYTNCPDTCPIQTAQMRQIQDDFRNEKDLRLVSITVDPTRDTPEILSKYANRFSADPARWFFLTGDKKAIYKFAESDFRLGAVELPRAKRSESGATHTHSPRFVVVDREAQIRGYYVSTDPDAMKRLHRDLRILLLASNT